MNANTRQAVIASGVISLAIAALFAHRSGSGFLFASSGNAPTLQPSNTGSAVVSGGGSADSGDVNIGGSPIYQTYNLGSQYSYVPGLGYVGSPSSSGAPPSSVNLNGAPEHQSSGACCDECASASSTSISQNDLYNATFQHQSIINSGYRG